MGRIRFSSLGLERLLDWTTFTGMFPATRSGSQLGFLQKNFKRGSGFPMVLSSRSKCIILTYGRDIWPCSSYLYNWYVEFMGRKMYAYLGYLYCSAKGWSMPGLVLSQIQISWNMEYLEGMKEWSRRLPIWIYLNSIICNLKWRVDFSFSFSFFLEKMTPLSFARISWISLEFWMGKLLWNELMVYEMVVAGIHSWQEWMPIPRVSDWQASYIWASKWWNSVG